MEEILTDIQALKQIIDLLEWVIVLLVVMIVINLV